MPITLINKTKPFKPLTIEPVGATQIRLLGEPLVLQTHWQRFGYVRPDEERLEAWLAERDTFQPDRMD